MATAEKMGKLYKQKIDIRAAAKKLKRGLEDKE
jgi:hypothetical protein